MHVGLPKKRVDAALQSITSHMQCVNPTQRTFLLVQVEVSCSEICNTLVEFGSLGLDQSYRRRLCSMCSYIKEEKCNVLNAKFVIVV